MEQENTHQGSILKPRLNKQTACSTKNSVQTVGALQSNVMPRKWWTREKDYVMIQFKINLRS